VSPQQIEAALANAYGSRQVSNIYTATNQYFVILELEPRYQRDPAALSMLYVRSSSGALVPLNAVAKLTYGVGPNEREPSRPAALRHDFVRSAARRGPIPSDRPDPESGGGAAGAAHPEHEIHGYGAGVSGLAPRDGHPACALHFW